MPFRLTYFLLILCLWGTTLWAGRTHAAEFPLAAEERLAFVGSTLLEREAQVGYLETVLHSLQPEKKIRCRNLAWSGDTVFGDSRAGFQSAKEGYQRLLDVVKEWKPTILFLQYGFNESFAGEAGLGAFQQQYRKLIDDLAITKARIVLLAPLGATGPQAATINKNLDLYKKAIETIAREKQLRYLAYASFDDGFRKSGLGRWTENGLHLNSQGYEVWARATWAQLIDANPVTTDPVKIEALRQAVVEKNAQAFHRWRPQNETYLFGFRKHEQGKNAKEVFQFDPLIEKAEAKVRELSQNLR